MNFWKLALSITTACAWITLLILDARLRTIVTESIHSNTFSELYGPIAYLRPKVHVISLVLTFFALCLLPFDGKPRHRSTGPA